MPIFVTVNILVGSVTQDDQSLRAASIISMTATLQRQKQVARV